MKVAATVLTLIVISTFLSFAEGSKTYVGVMTDTMCAGDHAAMVFFRVESGAATVR